MLGWGCKYWAHQELVPRTGTGLAEQRRSDSSGALAWWFLAGTSSSGAEGERTSGGAASGWEGCRESVAQSRVSSRDPGGWRAVAVSDRGVQGAQRRQKGEKVQGSRSPS